VKKTILIAPYEGPLAAALAAEALSAGWSVALGLVRAAPQLPGEVPEGAVIIYYEPRSYVSVASLALSARNAQGELDAAVLVFDPAGAKADFLSGRPGDLAALVEGRCAGPLFLARELVRRFEGRRGSLLLLAPESPRDAALGPLASMADGAFEGLGTGLFAAAAASTWTAYGIRDASGQPDRAARLALELLGEARPAKAGRWLRHTGKSGIFG
jgi:hypothetical protein